MSRYDSLLARIPAKHAHSDTVHKAAVAAIAVAEKFAARKVSLAESGAYTGAGVSAALREEFPRALRQMQVAKAPIAKLAREAKAARAAIKPQEPARDDVVGAIERQEMRTYWRSLSPVERATLGLTTKSIPLLEAALSSAPELSGFGAAERDVAGKIEARYLQIKFPGEMRQADETEHLISEAEAILSVARNVIQRTTDMDTRQFESEAAKIEKAVWLVGDAAAPQVCELQPDGTAVYRTASADEIATGERYANAEEYQAARGVA